MGRGRGMRREGAEKYGGTILLSSCVAFFYEKNTTYFLWHQYCQAFVLRLFSVQKKHTT